MQRYFLAEFFQQDALISVKGDNHHHMKRVMRMKRGEQCILVFLEGVSVLATVQDILEEETLLEGMPLDEANKELPIDITIACAFPKGEKAEWMTQKGSELGAKQIHFFPSEYSVVKWDDKKREKKEARFQKIALSACEQSQRTHLTKITLFKDYASFLQSLSTYDTVLVAFEESAKEGEKKTLAHFLEKVPVGEKVLCIFGSEGGISAKEVRDFERNDALFMGLGPRIMRCETAPMYFLSALSFALELQR